MSDPLALLCEEAHSTGHALGEMLSHVAPEQERAELDLLYHIVALWEKLNTISGTIRRASQNPSHKDHPQMLVLREHVDGCVEAVRNFIAGAMRAPSEGQGTTHAVRRLTELLAFIDSLGRFGEEAPSAACVVGARSSRCPPPASGSHSRVKAAVDRAPPGAEPRSKRAARGRKA